MDDILTLKEAARILGVTRARLYKIYLQGKIPTAYRLDGRFIVIPSADVKAIDAAPGVRGYPKGRPRTPRPNVQKTEPPATQLLSRKLTDEQVAEIKRLYDTQGYTVRQLAEIYAVSHEAIDMVLRGKTYAWVE